MAVMRNRKGKGDVEWRIPGRKKPIAYSTKAVSDLIALLAIEYGGTIREIQERIVYDHEAKGVLQTYVDHGCGGQIAAEWFNY